MCEEREKVRCKRCELVQWSDRTNCRRCGTELPEPILKIVERVVEKVVIGGHDPMRTLSLQQVRDLIPAATNRLTQWRLGEVDTVRLAQVPEPEAFPTMAEVERAMILAAYQKSNRRALEAARLLGIGKTTVYRKLKEIGEAAA